MKKKYAIMSNYQVKEKFYKSYEYKIILITINY